MLLNGTYAGTVEAVADPAKLGRVKARVPMVHGVQGASAGFIGTNNIQWAFPTGLPAGGTARSGGFSHLPRVGDHVWIRFLDGEPEKPIWEWGSQDQSQIVDLPLNTYDPQSGEPVDRSFWTRFSHSIEISPDSVVVATNTGYAMQFAAGEQNAMDGFILLQTPRGHQIDINDESQALTINCVEDFYLNVPDEIVILSLSTELNTVEELTVVVGTDFSLTASANIDLSATLALNISADAAMTIAAQQTLDVTANAGMTLATDAVMTLNFQSLFLNAGATEPFVKGTQMVAFLNSLLLYLTTHTHGNGNNGSPTSPPIIPPQAQVQPQVASLISSTIFGG